MKYLPEKENKLVQAINRKDWPAVRNTLENEPHLNETHDEIGATPLMYAVSRHAPDDVLENMIETASVENLGQQQRFGGSTILNLLAFFARVSAMRCVLERTNKNINTQDDFGRTPLHDCLGDWGMLSSYEEHRQTAICLITYGASAAIKNKDGKTPLDVYDENECKRYEDTTRKKKKKELRDLLEEVLARGPDAVKAFKDATDGEITVNSRLTFLGQEGLGKTSCAKAMLGKEFNETEPSTDGIDTTTVFQIDEDYNKLEQKDVDDLSVVKKRKIQHSDELLITKKLKTSEQIAMEALSDEEFSILNTYISQWYDSHKCLPMLKVLFRDKLDNHELSQVNGTMDLLNKILARGHLSSQNLRILCDTISVTKHFGLLLKIKKKLPSFPDVKEGTISGSFTPHRQKLMKFGMVLSSGDVKQIDGLYNKPCKDYTDRWSMISDLEHQQIMSEDNIKKFIDKMKILNLPLAIKALT
ncbi:uncharacterized protein LOC117106506 [Anneissia japonica]|uniref:uncharacterized protein LOC117106506 n=1 Tax=Anneissia japonica TaxID=1529436 RepID=UPI001425844B|nr:uncharacterized protein LOC117106506 [Anneissia japonica]